MPLRCWRPCSGFGQRFNRAGASFCSTSPLLPGRPPFWEWGSYMAPFCAVGGRSSGLAEGRDRQVVAGYQGGQHQGGMKRDCAWVDDEPPIKEPMKANAPRSSQRAGADQPEHEGIMVHLPFFMGRILSPL